MKRLIWLKVILVCSSFCWEFVGVRPSEDIPTGGTGNPLSNRVFKISDETENISPDYASQSPTYIPLDEPEKLVPYSPITPNQRPGSYPLEKQYTQ